MATPLLKECRDCGTGFEPDQFAPTVFRCWPCRRAHYRKISSAHSLVYKSLKSGQIVREPCEVCGSAKVHAHHDDYSKPLSVRWLCPLHHKRHHANAEAA